MTSAAAALQPPCPESPDQVLTPPAQNTIASAVRAGLTASPKTLPPWLFYDYAGSALFEQITELPEYYLTRTERAIFAANADEIIARAAEPGNDPAPILTLIELGAGTATKTGILLRAAVRRQHSIVYQPVDVSPSALAAATENIRSNIPGVTVRCQVADYTHEPLPLNRLPNTRTLALYIGSSIGNFSPEDAFSLLRNVRAQLLPGDKLLLGTDLAPSKSKPIAMLENAYNDVAGVTAAFNKNILTRLNSELYADFRPACFDHRAIWNSAHSRIEMHLAARHPQTVHIPANSAGAALTLHFAAGETIHTENSYKFTCSSVEQLLTVTGFEHTYAWHDEDHLFAVTLATAI